MAPTLALIIATSFSFVTWIVLAITIAWPWLRQQTFRRAVSVVVAIHALRSVAMILFVTQDQGFPISDSTRDAVAYGDLAGATAAVLALLLLHFGVEKVARIVIWVLVVITVLDLGNAARLGLAEGLFGHAGGVTWLILGMYVPLLWVSTAVIAFLLLRKTPTDG